ncbi:139_t:CDS:2 [Paraglomus brasilianum]|uniref:139_t:CDS:1 n=1 Tax=Paraglomus brasilianum TaxID=144538 RepID=A0A9N9CWJ5_9GLOM|nr:139_t:CDS:2 [Paraglomus brasilianum]
MSKRIPAVYWAIQTVVSQKSQRKRIGMNGSKKDKPIAVGQSNDNDSNLDHE